MTLETFGVQAYAEYSDLLLCSFRKYPAKVYSDDNRSRPQPTSSFPRPPPTFATMGYGQAESHWVLLR